MQGARATVLLICIAISMALFYSLSQQYETMALSNFYAISFFFGIFVHGANNIVHTCCTSDVGKAGALNQNKRAMATVIGIIDGTGTLGSAIGQVVIIQTATEYGWSQGFWLVMAVNNSLGLIPCGILAYMELKALWQLRRQSKEAATDAY